MIILMITVRQWAVDDVGSISLSSSININNFKQMFLILVLLFTVDEMYLASLINKGREAYMKGATDPTALPAEVILNMVTVNGAKSVLWDNEIGSLEVGKKVL